jgi:hypothetical protein
MVIVILQIAQPSPGVELLDNHRVIPNPAARLPVSAECCHAHLHLSRLQDHLLQMHQMAPPKQESELFLLHIQAVGASMCSSAVWSVCHQQVGWANHASCTAQQHPEIAVISQYPNLPLGSQYRHDMMQCAAAADLIVLVSNNIGGSANSGTTGNWIKLQITVRCHVEDERCRCQWACCLLVICLWQVCSPLVDQAGVCATAWMVLTLCLYFGDCQSAGGPANVKLVELKSSSGGSWLSMNNRAQLLLVVSSASILT